MKSTGTISEMTQMWTLVDKDFWVAIVTILK